MIPLLAELAFTSVQFAGVVGSLAAILVIYNQARAAFGVNPPLHKSYASKEDLTQVHGRIKREREEINLAIAKIEAAQAAATIRVDSELRLIREGIAASQAAGEARVEKLRSALDEQTRLIISVIRERRA